MYCNICGKDLVNLRASPCGRGKELKKLNGQLCCFSTKCIKDILGQYDKNIDGADQPYSREEKVSYNDYISISNTGIDIREKKHCFTCKTSNCVFPKLVGDKAFCQNCIELELYLPYLTEAQRLFAMKKSL